jgi:GNAT superfamily N-acetyltransferase
MVETPTIRRATLDDLDTLVRLRVALMREMGAVDGVGEGALGEAVRRYLVAELPTGRFLAWVAVAGAGAPIACGGLVFLQKPPSPQNHSGREAYIMNMYTEPTWRGRGLAARIFDAIVAHVRGAGVDSLRLHATEAGRPLYERAGFRASDTEMVLQLPE